MTLRHQIGLLAAAGIGVLCVVGAGLRITHERQVSALARERTADALVVGLFELNASTGEYLRLGSPRLRDQWRWAHAQLGERLARFRPLSPEDRAEVALIRTHLADSDRLFEALVDLHERSSPATLAARQDGLAGELSVNLRSMVAAASRLTIANQARSIELHRQHDAALILCLGLMATLIILGPVLIDRSFARPLAALNRELVAIGRGDLDHRVSAGRSDEIGELAAAIDAMTANLKLVTASRDELDGEVARRARADEALLANERFLQAVFESIQDGISVLGKDLRILRANDAMLRWYPDAAPLEGRLCHEAYHQSSTPCEVCPSHRALVTGALQREVVPLRRGGQIQGWLELFAFPLRNETGGITGVVEYVRDITQRVRAEQALRESEQRLREQNDALARSNAELDDFAYVASHDLREPLRGVARYAEFLLEDYGARMDEEGRRRLEAMSRLCKREEALIEALLSYSRVGRTELAIEEVDIDEVVDAVLDSLRPMLVAAEAEIRRPGRLPVMVCDGARIHDVFTNLISNAVKYNDQSRKLVEIGVCPSAGAGPGAGPVFYVRDNGIGILPQHRERIFRIFKRLHGRDAYGGGSGAGLTIVKKIVERHGGRIWVESAPGEGATFCFTLGARRPAVIAA